MSLAAAKGPPQTTPYRSLIAILMVRQHPSSTRWGSRCRKTRSRSSPSPWSLRQGRPFMAVGTERMSGRDLDHAPCVPHSGSARLPVQGTVVHT
jgi:hypothetical protein